MDKQPSVLIIDSSSDTRDVLTAALARRGMSVFSASHVDAGAELLARHQPDLVVVDVDEPEVSGDSAVQLSSLCNRSGEPIPVILLGTIRRDCGAAATVVAKPYHYRLLVFKIEQALLAREGRGGVQTAA